MKIQNNEKRAHRQAINILLDSSAGVLGLMCQWRAICDPAAPPVFVWLSVLVSAVMVGFILMRVFKTVAGFPHEG